MRCCLICENNFIDKSPTQNKKFCSSKCRIKNYRNSEKGRKYFDSIREEKKLYLKKYYSENKEKNLNSCHNYYLRNKKIIKEKNRIRNFNKKNILKEINFNWRKKNPLKNKCHTLFRKDKNKNPNLYIEICMTCNSTENIDFHHPNYNFPYNVYPLCRSCHLKLHRS